MSRRTIQSPGVEIREIDLTQRPAEPLGTSVFIPGFSNQGPTDEVLNVGTFADFEEIYGKPTTAAERYFYHSVKQVFNSDANVYVSRLPYGENDGLSDASNKYTALVYPVVSPHTKSFEFGTAVMDSVSALTATDDIGFGDANTVLSSPVFVGIGISNVPTGGVSAVNISDLKVGATDNTDVVQYPFSDRSSIDQALGTVDVDDFNANSRITLWTDLSSGKLAFADSATRVKIDAISGVEVNPFGDTNKTHRIALYIPDSSNLTSRYIWLDNVGWLNDEIVPFSTIDMSDNFDRIGDLYSKNNTNEVYPTGIENLTLQYKRFDDSDSVEVGLGTGVNGTYDSINFATDFSTTVTDADSIAVEIITKDSNNNKIYTTKVLNNLRLQTDSSDSVSKFAGTDVESLSTISSDTLVKGLAYHGVTSNAITELNGFETDNTVGLSGSDYYVIGNPTLVELSQADYNKFKNGEFTWSNNAAAGANKTFTSSDVEGAGIIVLNTAKTTVNNNFEGYYVGLIDGVNLNPATNFDGVVNQYVATSTGNKIPGNFSIVPSSRLDYTLSATSTSNERNISRTLEEVPRFNIQGAEFVDTISLGLFKSRITPFANDTLNLGYFLAEGYTGSLNSYRKLQNENGGEKKSFFLEEQDDGSNNISILVNPYISKYDGDWTSSTVDAPTKFVRVNRTTTTGTSNDQAEIRAGLYTSDLNADSNYNRAQGVFGLGSYATTQSTAKNLGSIPDKLERVFNIASNVDQFNIDVSIEAGLGTIFTTIKAGNGVSNSLSAFDDTAFLDLGSTTGRTGFYTINENMVGASSYKNIRDNYRAVFNLFEQFARETRKDHIFIADPIRQLLVQGEDSKIMDKKSNNFSTHVYWPLRHQYGFANTNYSAVYANWIKVYDAVSDKQVWIPFSGNAASIYARNDASFAPWYAPAGYSRGIVSAANDIAISPTQRQRDQLYRIAMNPVTQFPSDGIVVFGQKTLQRKPTAFDRVNVRRLFLDLEKRTRETLKFFIFEPNTFLTRTKVVNTLTPIFENCKQTEGVYDYLIVCDERNNPSSRIENNELIVDIYLKPVRAAEFILVNFYAVNNDVNFEELINQ